MASMRFSDYDHEWDAPRPRGARVARAWFIIVLAYIALGYSCVL